MSQFDNFYVKLSDDPDDRAEIALYSLAEYEADGGRYCDSGNGGEDWADFIARRADFTPAGGWDDDYDRFDQLPVSLRNAVRRLFACALAVRETPPGVPALDAVNAAMGDARPLPWLDSSTDYYLCEVWPDSAPLHVRCDVEAAERAAGAEREEDEEVAAQ